MKSFSGFFECLPVNGLSVKELYKRLSINKFSITSSISILNPFLPVQKSIKSNLKFYFHEY